MTSEKRVRDDVRDAASSGRGEVHRGAPAHRGRLRRGEETVSQTRRRRGTADK